MNEKMNINFLYMDGIAGRQFYMKINSVRIDVGWRPEDAVARAKEILADLSINFYGEIEFVSDGTLG